MGKVWAALAVTTVLLGTIAAAVLRLHRQPPIMQATVSIAQGPAEPSEISLPGRVLPVKIVNVPPPFDGIIDKITADVGDDVFVGQVLARIRNPKLESFEERAISEADRARTHLADLEQALINARLQASSSHAEAVRAKADLERAEKNYERQQQLMAVGATPRLDFEKAEKEYNTQKTNAETLEKLASEDEERVSTINKELQAAQGVAEQKRDTVEDGKTELAAGEVKSPVDGVIVARHGQAGDEVNRSLPNLFEIGVDLKTLQVALTPDTKILARLHPGQHALIEIAQAPGRIEGALREIKGGEAFIVFTSPSQLVRPGLTAQVTIKLG